TGGSRSRPGTHCLPTAAGDPVLLTMVWAESEKGLRKSQRRADGAARWPRRRTESLPSAVAISDPLPKKCSGCPLPIHGQKCIMW
ncbi:Dynein Intermediate Chain 2, Axonemal, partial [Manis pentadactyla]